MTNDQLDPPSFTGSLCELESDFAAAVTLASWRSQSNRPVCQARPAAGCARRRRTLRARWRTRWPRGRAAGTRSTG
jgi:hypothetical protein